MANSPSVSKPEDLLREGAREIGLSLEPEQIRTFLVYADELLRWNRKMNLIALREETPVLVKHFLASLAFAVAFPHQLRLRLVDVGSGAGFPGVPIKIACPHLSVTLVEASRKKISFLQHICALLSLPEIECVRARAEELTGDPRFREKFDVSLARAVGRREALLEIAGPLLRPRGQMILSGREKEEGALPETPSLLFKESLRVKFSCLNLERSLLVWEKRG